MRITFAGGFLLAAASLLTAGENLLPDGGFEEKTLWRTLGTASGMGRTPAVEVSADAARTGKQGMIVRDVWDFSRPYALSKAIPVKPAPGYRFTFYARAPKEQIFRAEIVQLGVRPDGKSGSVRRTKKFFTAKQEWQKYTLEAPGHSKVTSIELLIGAAREEVRDTGLVYADDAALEIMDRAPGSKTGSGLPKITLEVFSSAPAWDETRVEKTIDGFRLKPGIRSRVGIPSAPPDVRFTAVRVPQDGFYRFYIRVIGPRMNEFCRLGIPDFPASRMQMMRESMQSGDLREIGVYPLKKGTRVITFTLPEKLTLGGIFCRLDGPIPQPPAMAAYRLPFTPVKTHPRLFVNPQRLEELRKNIRHPELADALAFLRRQAADPVELIAVPGEEVVVQNRLRDKLLARAFFAMLEKDGRLARETAKTMHTYFTRLTGFPTLNYHYDLRDNMVAAAFVYDWLYDALTPQERREMIAAFYRLAPRQEGSYPPLRQSVAYGHGNEHAIGFLAFGLACYDEDPEPFRIMTYQIMEDWLPMRQYEYRSLLHPQGTSYGPVRLSHDYLFDALYRIGCRQALLPPGAYRIPYWLLMLRLPDGSFVREGDYWGFTRMPMCIGRVLLFASSARRDGMLKHAYNTLPAGPAAKESPLYHVLFHDTAVCPVRPELPLIRYFGPFQGSLIARTGYGPDDVLAHMTGGSRHNGNHRHSDAGAFQLYYRGMLAADIGEYASTYGCAYDCNFNKRSIAHNMLRVYDPEEKFRGGKNDNDGGSRFVTRSAKKPQEYERDPEFDYGTTRFVAAGPGYGVMQADLAGAYTRKIRRYCRTFVFLDQRESGRPASLIVLDFCESARPEFAKVVQVSTLCPPEIRGPRFVLASEGGGRADGELFLPRNAKVTDFAGKRSLYNAFTGKQQQSPFSDTPGTRAHRMEFAPTVRQTQDTFLMHFGVRDAAALPLPAAYRDGGRCHIIRSGKFFVILPKEDTLLKEKISVTVPEQGMFILAAGLAAGPWHGAGRNFTVKPGENTLCFSTDSGDLVLSPGSLAGAPAYQEPAPVVRKTAAGIRFGDKILDGTPVFEKGTAWVPAASFRNLPPLAPGQESVVLNGLAVKLDPAPRMIGGKLHVQAGQLAGMLHAAVIADPYMELVRFRPLPEQVPAVVSVTASADPARLAAIIGAVPRMGGPGSWGDRKPYHFTLTFDREMPLGRFVMEFPYGITRRYPVKIETSTDGKNFRTVFDGLSTAGRTVSLFQWQPCRTRFLRVSGRGSAGNPWTSISRIDF